MRKEKKDNKDSKLEVTTQEATSKETPSSAKAVLEVSGLKSVGKAKVPAESAKKEKRALTVEDAIEDINNRILAGEIDLDYALIGFKDYSSRKIYSNDILIDLLINYGYNVNVAMAFVETLIELDDEEPFPIIMTGTNRIRIYTEVEKIKGVDKFSKVPRKEN